MAPTIIVISSDDEDTIEVRTSCTRPRRNPSCHPENLKLQTAHYQSSSSTDGKTSLPSSLYPVSNTQASGPHSSSIDILSLSNGDYKNIVARSLSAPQLDCTPLEQMTRSVESQIKNKKQTASGVAKPQDTPDVLITGRLTRHTSLPLRPCPDLQRNDPALCKQSFQAIRSSGPSANEEVHGEETHSHTYEVHGSTSTLFNSATTAAAAALATCSSQQQPLLNDLSGITIGAYEEDGFVTSPKDTDMSPQSEDPITPPQQKTSSQTSFPSLKRKEQPYINERAAGSKRTRIICSPVPTILPPATPNHQSQPQSQSQPQAQPQPQPQSPFNLPSSIPSFPASSPPFPSSSPLFPSSSPPFPSSSLPYPSPADTPTVTPNARRTRSRPWTGAMIADMAQTLQYSFPFAEFSAKYGKAPSEVFEAFSAVVQMPLFEYSAKGMAKARMKGFHDRIREYRDKGRDIQKMHRMEERKRKEKEKAEKEKQKQNERGKGIGAANGKKLTMAGDVEGEGGESGDGSDITVGTAKKPKPKPALEQGAMMRASCKKHDDKMRKTTPIMIRSSSSECEPTTPTPTSTKGLAQATCTTTTTGAPAPAPSPKTPKHRKANPIAAAGPSNRTPVLELRDGIYVLAE